MDVRRGVIGLALALAGCGFPRPYSPEMLAVDALHVPERALVHYLSQAPPLTLDVCDPTSPGPHVPAVDERLIDAIDQGFAKGRIPVDHWTGCLAAMWRGAAPAVRERIAAGVLGAFPDTLAAADLEPNDAVQRLDAIVEVLEHRPPDALLPDEPASAALTRVEAALPGLAAWQRPLADRFVAEVGLDLGRWGGAPVDTARIALEQDESLLVRFAKRLPDEALRTAARERIVRLRIARGPWPEARAHEEEVVRTVLLAGKWALDPTEWPIRALRTRSGGSGPDAIVVVQDLVQGDANVRARTPEGALVDGIDLVPILALDVEGIASPVGLCTLGDGLDPTPCVDPGALSATHPLVSVRDGILDLPEAIPTSTVTALARLGYVEVPVAVGEAKASMAWPVTFAPPPPLILTGQVMGAPGPDLVARIRVEATRRLVYEITRGETVHVVVVEPSHLAGFRVVSQGAAGMPGFAGEAGRPGWRGADGLDAVCPYTRGTNGAFGGDGGPGGAGGAGGAGGNGGAIQVFLRCSTEASCRDLLDRVEPTLVSLGGAGGAGGKGGSGGEPGDGGRGGDSASCTHLAGGANYVEGGYDGTPGLRGDNGPDGPPGPEGRPGTITIKAVP